MKKLLTTMGALALTFAFATAASAQIDGSVHDFAGLAWNDAAGTSGQICNVCHTPHNPSYSVANADAPLWDHEVTTATFTTYGVGYAMQATAGQPTGTSKLCLSCHDGTVALENFGGVVDAVSPTYVAGNALIGTDLSNDHPVAISYSAGDPELNATTAPLSWDGTSDVASLLNGGNVECSSCHDVHRGGTSATNGHLLRGPLTNSQLCLACHNK